MINEDVSRNKFKEESKENAFYTLKLRVKKRWNLFSEAK
jgi:hypothetical protein